MHTSLTDKITLQSTCSFKLWFDTIKKAQVLPDGSQQI